MLVVCVGAVVLLQAATVVIMAPVNGYVMLLGGLTIAAGRFSIKIPDRPASVSFSEIFLFTSMVLFGAPPATLTVDVSAKQPHE
jgi:hypothetical protein